MLTLVSGKPVSKGKVIRSLELCLMAKETTGVCDTGLYLNMFIFGHLDLVK